MRKLAVIVVLLASSAVFSQGYYVCLGSFRNPVNAKVFSQKLLGEGVGVALARSGDLYRIVLNKRFCTIMDARDYRDLVQDNPIIKRLKITGVWVCHCDKTPEVLYADPQGGARPCPPTCPGGTYPPQNTYPPEGNYQPQNTYPPQGTPQQPPPPPPAPEIRVIEPPSSTPIESAQPKITPTEPKSPAPEKDISPAVTPQPKESESDESSAAQKESSQANETNEENEENDLESGEPESGASTKSESKESQESAAAGGESTTDESAGGSSEGDEDDEEEEEDDEPLSEDEMGDTAPSATPTSEARLEQ